MRPEKQKMLGFIVDFDSENLQLRIGKPFDFGPVT